MAKKRGTIIQFVKFREPHKAEDGVRTSEEMDANPRSETLIQMPRKRRQSLHLWTFKGWVAPSPFLTEILVDGRLVPAFTPKQAQQRQSPSRSRTAPDPNLTGQVEGTAEGQATTTAA
jgi:hypothetical protein